ncbi:uncharacterized protein [Scyliorhinus torazame]
MQRLPHLGPGQPHNIIIVNRNGLPQLPGGQVSQTPGRSIAHQQQQPQAAGLSRLHQHPEAGLRTSLLQQDASHSARRSTPQQQQSNRSMATSILQQRPLHHSVQGPLIHPVDYFYDLGQMNSLEQPSTRMDLPRYSNPVPFTLQNLTTAVPQASDFHFSLYVLLPPPEHSIRFQQPPVTVYEGSQTFYTTLPIQVRNAVYAPRSSGSQASQPQAPLPSLGNANAHCLPLQQFRQLDWKQRQHYQSQEIQVLQGVQAEVVHPLSKQQQYHHAPTQYDFDVISESETVESEPATGQILNLTACDDDLSQENRGRHPIGHHQAQSSDQEVERGCGKGDGVGSTDENEECEKKLMMLTFEDAVMMFDFELFEHPALSGHLPEQEQAPTFHVQNKGRNKERQKRANGKVDEEALPKEENSGFSALETQHCATVKLTLAKRPMPSARIETPSLPRGFPNDHSFYNLKPEQVNLQMLLELEDISDDESCWASLSLKSRIAVKHGSRIVETPPKAEVLTNRKRKRQFLDLES